MSIWEELHKEYLYKLKLLLADLRQKIQDERDGAEEALKGKDEEIAALRLTVANQDNRISELQLRCSNLESAADGYRASLGPADYEGV